MTEPESPRPYVPLIEGRYRRPMWASGSVLEVPKDGPWAYLHAPGLEKPHPVLVTECAEHDDWLLVVSDQESQR